MNGSYGLSGEEVSPAFTSGDPVSRGATRVYALIDEFGNALLRFPEGLEITVDEEGARVLAAAAQAASEVLAAVAAGATRGKGALFVASAAGVKPFGKRAAA